MLIRRFFAFVVSLFILFSLPLNAANAAGLWTPTGTNSVGSRTIVSATSGGFKSAINLAPNAIGVGLRLLKIANTAALVYSAMQLADGGIDFVLDPANNRVKYKQPGIYMYTYNNGSVDYQSMTMDGICGMLATLKGYTSHPTIPHNASSRVCAFMKDGSLIRASVNYNKVKDSEAYIPLSDVSQQLIKNAAQGHELSQDVVAQAAAASVAAGDWDTELMTGAIPITDTRPPIPVVPGSQTGDSNEGVQGATPGEQAENARLEAERQKKQAAAAAEAAKAAAEAARKAADKAQDLINQSVDEAIKEAAKTAAEAAKKAAEQAKAVADRAAAEAAQAAKDAAKAADKAVNDVKTAADAAAKELADAIASGDAARIAAAEAAKAAAEAALTDAKAKQEAAEKEAAKAKEEAAKPFELPAFCSWAAPVCDFINWFKEPPPADLPAGDVPFATTGDVGLDDVDRFEKRITFSGQCPSNEFSFSMMGVTYAKPIPYHHLCGFLEQIAPWLLAMCYLGTAYFVVENI